MTALWMLLGSILVLGIRGWFYSRWNNGQSIATIARRLLGRGPFIALMLFLILLLGLVTAVFLNTSASALVSMLDFGRMNLDPGQTIFRVVQEGGTSKVVIGGVASMSVVIITLMAPLVGWMTIIRKISVWKCSLIATAICLISIWIGLYYSILFHRVCPDVSRIHQNRDLPCLRSPCFTVFNHQRLTLRVRPTLPFAPTETVLLSPG